MARTGYPSDKQDQFMIRFPDGLRDRIKAAAAANNRSMNAEIVATLEEAYPPEPTLEDLLYFADLLASDFVDAPDYPTLRKLRDTMKDVVEQLKKGQKEGYPRPEMEVAKERMIAEGILDANGDYIPPPKKGRALDLD